MESPEAPRGRPSAGGAWEPNDGIPALAEGMWRWYTELGRLWLECLTSYVPGAEALRSDPPGAVSIAIDASRPVRATLELPQPLRERQVQALELRASDARHPPLTDVGFETGGPGAPPVLRIRVPHGQPPDTYVGTIVDRDDDRPLGRITVRLSP